MAISAETAHSSKLTLVVHRLSKEAPEGLAARFAKRLFDEVDTAEIEAYDISDLVALATDAFESFRTRTPGLAKIVLRRRTVKTSEFLCIDIVNDDMPFLLDSVLGELRDLALVPELVAHPVFEVRRDAVGTLSELDPARLLSNGSPRESFIHLQIRKLGPQPSDAMIEKALLRVLSQVRAVVSDFGAMIERLHRAISQFERTPPPADAETNAEAIAFLKWLCANNFTFLGIREYGYLGGRESGQLLPRPELGLGLLRDMDISVLRRGAEEHRLTSESRGYFLNSPPVIVAKSNSIATVHRRAHMDTIGVKLYDEDGRIAGEMTVAGLFTASAYHVSTRDIPLLRRKVERVLMNSPYPPESYSGRALVNVLETFPRDELFQISEEQLARISEEVLKIDLSPRPRVFVRRDEFGRFLSVFVYVPRERYNTDIRVAIAAMLEAAFDGRFDSFTPFFPEGGTVRIHFVIWRKDVELRYAEEAELEKRVEGILRTWGDEFRDRVLTAYGNGGFDILEKYLHAFPAGYQETNRPSRALEDVQRLEKLGPDRRTDIDIYRESIADPFALRATLQQLDEPLTLSKRVPILENFGFDVVAERTFRLTPKIDGVARLVYLHDSDLRLRNGAGEALPAWRQNLEDGFLAVWSDSAANDRFNGLILASGLDWRQAALIRAYACYLRQTGVAYGLAYVSEALNKHASIAADLISLFNAMFDPANGLQAEERNQEQVNISARIAAKLDKIPILDEDRILRNFLALINATLRSNFYHRERNGAPPETIAFKIRSHDLEWLPAPKPFAEIFVYSPRFEAIHLRGGPIARGGLRWSDRPQDFRTEILSLAKAQQVKNVVIVPKGAKGGFVPRAYAKASREAIQAEGVACYKAFVSALLSITDNLVKGEIVPPANTVRRDGDDPYLVVAADKGTATFSDIANEIALSRGFWLGDAFASGGSAGYDHKKMAITALGAWEAVKRHFREMNIDIATTPFTVAGIGDMSGDVFGNGMLLSKAIKLVAAFDHRDIFLDPDPDPMASWTERKRLFDLPRSSWQDYDRARISAGGGVYSRSEKYISPSLEVQRLLSIGATVTPSELITAILKAPVDLLWFGGIGTYVRASAETDAQVGDKANDALRITAREVKARVAGEGANLGMTQRGRIEFASNGGRINTDAIDNSAGVNTSDVEVNIKIALGAAIAAGKLDTATRNRLLAAMTEEVSSHVLRNNYLQTLAISIAEKEGIADLGFQQRLIHKLERQGRLDRVLEALPSDAELVVRGDAGKPLTRPELAVLLAYSKISLEDDLINSNVPDDPYFGQALMNYFPPLMRERFAQEIESHQLRREIIATSLTNDIINSGGPTFIIRLAEETGHAAKHIAYAFAAVMAVYSLPDIYREIDALDGKIDGQRQLGLYRKVQDLLRKQTAWFLRRRSLDAGLEAEIARYRDSIGGIAAALDSVQPEKARARLAEEEERLRQEGVPVELARRIAVLDPLLQALDIADVAASAGVPIAVAARTVFAIRDAFLLDELADAGEALAGGDYFNQLAVNSSLETAASAQRALAKSVLAGDPSSGNFALWRERNEPSASSVAKSLADRLDGRALTLAKLTVAVAQLRDLAGA